MYILACDFDGCLAKTNPKTYEIEAPNLALFSYLRFERQRGTKILLWTCREKKALQEAVDFCLGYGLAFDAVNENVPEIIQAYGYSSRKIFAHKYLDDRNFIFAFDDSSLNDQIFEQAEHKR